MDATTLWLAELFLGLSIPTLGATAGMVLFVFGLSRERRSWWLGGLLLGAASMLLLVGVIAWALKLDAVRGLR